MNQNIEVLNENLIAIEFEHINSELVEDLSLINLSLSAPICFTNDGKLVLSKSHKDFVSFRKLLAIIMKFKDDQLGTDKGFYFFIRIFAPTIDNLNEQAFEKYVNTDLVKQFRKLFNQLSETEKNRRTIKEEYTKGIKKLNGIDKIKKIFKRKGV